MLNDHSTNIDDNQERQRPSASSSKECLSLFCLGTCAWALVNGIFAELPILIRDWCNNDWSIVSNIALCISLSNLAPFLWTVFHSTSDRGDGTTTNYSAVIGIGFLLAFGTMTSLFFILLHNDGDFVLFSGKAWILLLSACSGLVGTMSLVLFYPRATAFSSNTKAIPSLANGTAMANFLLAIVAMIQNPGGSNPNFSLSTYFTTVAFVFVISVMGFIGTIVLLVEQKKKNKNSEELKLLLSKQYSSVAAEETSMNSASHRISASSSTSSRFVVCDPRFRIPYLIQFLWNFAVFFLPGVVPYAVKSIPGNGSPLALSYLTISQLLSHTIGTALTSIISFQHQKGDNDDYRLTMGFGLAIALFWVPLVFRFCIWGTTYFLVSLIPIAMNAILCGCYSYTSTRCFQIVASRARNTPATESTITVDQQQKQEQQEYVTRIMGVVHQLGAMIGSAFGFWMVTKLK